MNMNMNMKNKEIIGEQEPLGHVEIYFDELFGFR